MYIKNELDHSHWNAQHAHDYKSYSRKGDSLNDHCLLVATSLLAFDTAPLPFEAALLFWSCPARA